MASPIVSLFGIVEGNASAYQVPKDSYGKGISVDYNILQRIRHDSIIRNGEVTQTTDNR